MTDQLPGVGKIHESLVAIMGEVGGVGKTRKNESQHYSYRGIADITLACQPVMAKHGVHVVPHAVLKDDMQEFTTAKGASMFRVRQTIQFRFYHADGSFAVCETTGEGMDSGDKATNKAMSSALKYALTQTFCIPEADPADTEKDSPEVTGRAKAKATAKPQEPKDDRPKVSPEDARLLMDAARRAGAKTIGTYKAMMLEVSGVESADMVAHEDRQSVLDKLTAKADALKAGEAA